MDHPQHPSDRLRLRRGHLVDDASRDPLALHRVRLTEATRELGEDSYFCLASAGVIHGLPLFHADLDRPHAVHTNGGHGRIDSVLHTYRTPLVRPQTTIVDGLPVTSLTRTAGDLMRRLPFGPALATADAALRLGASRSALFAEVRTGRRCRIATEAVRRADARSESPYESLTRALMLQEGLPLPELQVEFHDAAGFVGRVDFYWKRQRLVGEFDGAVKLDELLAPGQTRTEALAARGVRDDRLRGLRLRVLHWDADDIHDPGRFAASVRPYLADARVDHGLCPEAMGFRRSRGRERGPRRK